MWCCSAPNCPGLAKFSFYIAASPLWGSAGRVICWRMDSGTSPSAPRRMTGWGECWEEWKFYFKVTKHKGVRCFVYGVLGDAVWNGFGFDLPVGYIDWGCLYLAKMKLWVLALEWCWSCWLLIVVCIAFWNDAVLCVYNRCSLSGSAIDAVYSSFGLNHLLSIGQKRIFECSSLRHTLNEPYSSPTLNLTPCPAAGWIFLELRNP